MDRSAGRAQNENFEGDSHCSDLQMFSFDPRVLALRPSTNPLNF